MKTYVVLILLFFSAFVIGQNSHCKVIISKGVVQCQMYDIPEWSDISSGSEISSECNVKLGSKSSLVIMNDVGITIELNKPGIYKLKELIKSRNNKNTNHLLKFGKYIKEQLFSSKVDKSIPGAVDRSLYLVRLLYPFEGKFVNPEIDFAWEKFKENSLYTFYLLDSYGTNIYTTQITDTSLNLNLNNLGITPDQIYSWYVTADVDSIISKERYIILSSEKDKKEYSEYESQFLRENEDLDSFSLLMLAIYFQQNDVVDKADEYFKKAIDKNSDIDEYRKMYERFINSKQ